MCTADSYIYRFLLSPVSDPPETCLVPDSLVVCFSLKSRLCSALEANAALCFFGSRPHQILSSLFAGMECLHSHAHPLLPDSDEHLVPEGPQREWRFVVRNFSDAGYDFDGDGLASRNV